MLEVHTEAGQTFPPIAKGTGHAYLILRAVRAASQSSENVS